MKAPFYVRPIEDQHGPVDPHDFGNETLHDPDDAWETVKVACGVAGTLATTFGATMGVYDDDMRLVVTVTPAVERS